MNAQNMSYQINILGVLWIEGLVNTCLRTFW